MHDLESIAEYIHQDLDARTAARDRALSQARTLTRHCAHAIRAAHREDWAEARRELGQARELADALREGLGGYPDLYYAGYTQDALKEFAEASIVHAVIQGDELPTPQALNLESAAYLNGLAETVGEMRRRCLDILRGGYDQQVEDLIAYMDEVYGVLVTMDYPNAITGGLRRQTDIVRGITERTRGDVTLSLRQQHLESSLRDLEARLPRDEKGPAEGS
jgi:translin